MTPFDTVLQRYELPNHIEPFPEQVRVVNALAPLDNEGFWLDMGCGKTLTSTMVALYRHMIEGRQCVVIMPPILVPQWGAWLRSIRPAIDVIEYKGSPKERKALTLDHTFVLVGIQIFKRDYSRFRKHHENGALVVIVDEATMIANIDTDSHEKVYEFAAGHVKLMLSGTPVNKPGDAYGLMKFTAPGVYRNKKHFENLHADERDFFKTVISWTNLELLNQNLMTNSARILFEDLYRDVEAPLFDTIGYDLDPDHMRLYRKLAEEELLRTEDGGKIDATTVQKLRHALGQIIVNHDHFSGNDGHRSAALDLIQQKLDELGDRKLVVFADYRMTVRQIVKRFAHVGALAINSEVSETRKQANLTAFKEDPKCRLIVIQFISGGKGLDGLQHVCHHCMFVEPCLQPRDFHQAVARLKRLGQRYRVLVWLAVANGTIQVHGFKSLLNNDDVVNSVIRNAYSLRGLVFGTK